MIVGSFGFFLKKGKGRWALSLNDRNPKKKKKTMFEDLPDKALRRINCGES